MRENGNLKTVLAWILVAISLPLNGVFLFLGYTDIKTDLASIKQATGEMPAIRTQVQLQEKRLDLHEAKLNDLAQKKLDKPGS